MFHFFILFIVKNVISLQCNIWLKETSTLLQCRFVKLINIRSTFRSQVPTSEIALPRGGAPSFSVEIASFHTISPTYHLAPLPRSVYKRSPGDGGRRCSVDLARCSPSNLRLAPSPRVLLSSSLLHRLPPPNTWLTLVENSRCQRGEVRHIAGPDAKIALSSPAHPSLLNFFKQTVDASSFLLPLNFSICLSLFSLYFQPPRKQPFSLCYPKNICTVFLYIS